MEEQRILGVSNMRIGPAPHRKGLMNSQARVDRVKDLYRLNFGMFPKHMESIARDYCESYGSAPMAYVRRQQRFEELDARDCELIERLFRAGTTQTALMDALDERRAEWGLGEAPEPLGAF